MTTTSLSTFPIFSDLSPELQAHVLSQAEPEDYPNLALTCKTFHEFIYEKGLEGVNYTKFASKFFVQYAVKNLMEEEIYTRLIPSFSDKTQQKVRDETSNIPSFKQFIEEVKEKMYKDIKMSNILFLKSAKFFQNTDPQPKRAFMKNITTNIFPDGEFPIFNNPDFRKEFNRIISNAAIYENEDPNAIPALTSPPSPPLPEFMQKSSMPFPSNFWVGPRNIAD